MSLETPCFKQKWFKDLINEALPLRVYNINVIRGNSTFALVCKGNIRVDMDIDNFACSLIDKALEKGFLINIQHDKDCDVVIYSTEDNSIQETIRAENKILGIFKAYDWILKKINEKQKKDKPRQEPCKGCRLCYGSNFESKV